MELKKLIMNKKTSQEDRFEAVMKLSSLPRNVSSIRVKNSVNYQEGPEVL